MKDVTEAPTFLLNLSYVDTVTASVILSANDVEQAKEMVLKSAPEGVVDLKITEVRELSKEEFQAFIDNGSVPEASPKTLN